MILKVGSITRLHLTRKSPAVSYEMPVTIYLLIFVYLRMFCFFSWKALHQNKEPQRSIWCWESCIKNMAWKGIFVGFVKLHWIRTIISFTSETITKYGVHQPWNFWKTWKTCNLVSVPLNIYDSKEKIENAFLSFFQFRIFFSYTLCQDTVVSSSFCVAEQLRHRYCDQKAPSLAISVEVTSQC